MQFENGNELCSHIHRVTGDTVILSFSGGKDSVGAYIQLKRHFGNVVPVYMYTVPGLKFVEDSLRYYEEQVMGRHILRFPHPSLFRLLNNLILQSPEHCRIIERADLPIYDYDALFQIVREVYGISDDAYVATGVSFSTLQIGSLIEASSRTATIDTSSRAATCTTSSTSVLSSVIPITPICAVYIQSMLYASLRNEALW